MNDTFPRPTILANYIELAARQPAGPICDAMNREGLTPAQILSRAYALAGSLKKHMHADEKRVGVMLPTSLGNVCTLFALYMLGRTPTMVNFVSGIANAHHASHITQLRTILTSRAFVEKANLGTLIEGLAEAGLSIVYLEDMTRGVSLLTKLRAAFIARNPRLLHKTEPAERRQEEAVILFTSGSEGLPKGVALSHANILANVHQFLTRLDVGRHDRMFNCLPMYHSFGLTVGTWLPLLAGMQTMLYPSPLHYHEVPRLIAENHSTLLLSTDTFLTGYARNGEAEHFKTLRYIVPGAEKLKDSTVRHWRDVFGKTLYEGYGVTETAPVLSVNIPSAFKAGSVGQLLPGLEHKIKPVEGITEGGELWVRGPNVMMGYIKADAPGVIKPPQDGWHNTGDIAVVDENGFITIRGRLKRFAKIGGEMISLVSVEQAVSRVWPGILHAVVSVPHARKGEALVLLTEKQDATLDTLISALKQGGETQTPLPRQIFPVSAIPILGPGKLDFIGARRMALDLIEREARGGAAEQPLSAQALG